MAGRGREEDREESMVGHPVRVLVCGGRDYADARRLRFVLSTLGVPISVLIEGGARGADRLARRWAQDSLIPVETFPAEWDLHGRAAGFIRNKQMLDEGKPDVVVAFPGGKGTANMVALARRAGVEVVEVAE